MSLETAIQNLADAINRIADGAPSTTGRAANPAAVATPAVEPETAKAAPSRARPRKEVVTEAPVAPAEPVAVAPVAAPEPAAAEPEAPKALTKSDVQKAAIALVTSLGAEAGRPKLRGLIEVFGASNVSEVAESDYPKLLASIQAAMPKAA